MKPPVLITSALVGVCALACGGGEFSSSGPRSGPDSGIIRSDAQTPDVVVSTPAGGAGGMYPSGSPSGGTAGVLPPGSGGSRGIYPDDSGVGGLNPADSASSAGGAAGVDGGSAGGHAAAGSGGAGGVGAGGAPVDGPCGPFVCPEPCSLGLCCLGSPFPTGCGCLVPNPPPNNGQPFVCQKF